VDQSKAVQAKITKSSPSTAWKTLVSETVKLFHKFKRGHPERRHCRPRLLLITNRKSYTGSRLAPNSVTLNDLERKNWRFYGFFGDFWLDTSLYHSQGGATELLLLVCDPDREFGICILT